MAESGSYIPVKFDTHLSAISFRVLLDLFDPADLSLGIAICCDTNDTGQEMRVAGLQQQL